MSTIPRPQPPINVIAEPIPGNAPGEIFVRIRWTAPYAAAEMGVTDYRIQVRSAATTSYGTGINLDATDPPDGAVTWGDEYYQGEYEWIWDPSARPLASFNPTANGTFFVAVSATVNKVTNPGGGYSVSSERSIETRFDWVITPTGGDPASLPSPPLNVVATPTANGATITWQPPATGAPILNYTIVYKLFGPTSPETTVSVPASRRVAYIIGLIPPRTYSFYMQAQNAIGYSQPTARQTFKAIAPLAKPTNVRAISDVDKIVVAWEWSPTVDGPIATSFEVYWRPADAGPDVPYQRYDATYNSSTRSATLTGFLFAPQRYTFFVRAVSRKLYAPSFRADSAATRPVVMKRSTAGPVPGPTRFQPVSRGVLFRWQPPANPPRPVIGYVIYARETPTEDRPTLYKEVLRTAATSAVVPRLTNGVAYDFRIAAVYVGGAIGRTRNAPTNVTPQTLFNLNKSKLTEKGVPNAVADSILSAMSSWGSTVTFDPDIFAALRESFEDWDGIELASYTVVNEPGTWWAATCAPTFATVTGGELTQNVPVSFELTVNTARAGGAPSTLFLHELGHALGIGTGGAWGVGGICSYVPNDYGNGNPWFNNPLPLLAAGQWALLAYNADSVARHKTGPYASPKSAIPLEYNNQGYGQHWVTLPVNCGGESYSDVHADGMSYKPTAQGSISNTTVGFLLDSGFRLASFSRVPLFLQYFNSTAALAPVNEQEQFRTAKPTPKYVPHEPPITIDLSQGKQSCCCSTAKILGTLYLDGAP